MKSKGIDQSLNKPSLSSMKTLWLFSGRLIPAIVLFVIFILFSRKLSYQDYGAFQSVWMYTNIVNVIIGFGISSIIFSTNLNFLFYFARKNKNRLFLFYALLSLLTFLLFFLFSKNISPSLKILLIFFTLVQTTTSISDSLLIKQKGEKKSFIINFFYAVFFLGWHLYILNTHYSLFTLIGGILILSIFKWIVILLIPAIKESKTISYDESQFLKHWSYLGLNDVLGILAKWIDKFFLVFLLSAADFAIFFNGSFEIPLFGLLISVAGIFLTTEISADLFSTEKIKKIYLDTFNNLSAIVFPLFFFLFFFKEELFSFAFQDKYQASLPIFVISIFILPLRINNYTAILQCFSKGNIILLGALIDILLAILFMVILYPMMGTRGIVLAPVLATTLQSIFYVWQSAKALHIKTIELIPLKNLMIKWLLYASLFYCTSLLLQNFPLFIKLGCAAFITFLIIIIGSWKYINPLFRSLPGYQK
ncbi:MAG: oligosaccharide flippase family protein [Ginsengibacter sp.]